MTKPIRWAFFGAGRVAHEFIRALKTVPETTVVAVTSRTEANAKQFASDWGIAMATSDRERLLNELDFDIAYISTPHADHDGASIACLDRGKAVLCEKPLSTSACKATGIAEAARRNGVFCMEAMWTLCMPLVQEARRLVTEGSLGEPQMLRVDFSYPACFDPRDRLFDPSQGGGALLDRGVYGVALAHALFGTPDDVHAHALIGETGVDEQCSVLLRYNSGPLVVITAGLRCQGANEAVLSGTEGVLRLAAPFYKAQVLTHERVSPPSSPGRRSESRGAKLKRLLNQPGLKDLLVRIERPLRSFAAKNKSTRYAPLDCNGYEYEIREVMRCLRAGELESPMAPLDLSVSVLKTLDRARAGWGP